MIKQIVRDAFFLSQKSEEATKADLPIVTDLEDTLKANRERCVGMAANMIGYRKKITVRYLDRKFAEHTQSFSGYIAQIIQHEIDHFSGKLI